MVRHRFVMQYLFLEPLDAFLVAKSCFLPTSGKNSTCLPTRPEIIVQGLQCVGFAEATSRRGAGIPHDRASHTPIYWVYSALFCQTKAAPFSASGTECWSASIMHLHLFVNKKYLLGLDWEQTAM